MKNNNNVGFTTKEERRSRNIKRIFRVSASLTSDKRDEVVDCSPAISALNLDKFPVPELIKSVLKDTKEEKFKATQALYNEIFNACLEIFRLTEDKSVCEEADLHRLITATDVLLDVRDAFLELDSFQYGNRYTEAYKRGLIEEMLTWFGFRLNDSQKADLMHVVTKDDFDRVCIKEADTRTYWYLATA